jgi:hypothetical protein
MKMKNEVMKRAIDWLIRIRSREDENVDVVNFTISGWDIGSHLAGMITNGNSIKSHRRQIG